MESSVFRGFLVIDKPPGLTSRDVVDRAEQWFPRGTKIGHTGTLDPLATGVLVLAVGSAARLTEYVQDMGKVYQAGILLGARSATDDADGTIAPVHGVLPPARPAVEHQLQSFVGEIDQVPPAYSAAKVAGRRAYDLARRGQEVVLRPRRVVVYAIDLLAYDYPSLQLAVSCGKGTYIRSLARDLGEQLGCGGYIAQLRRTQVGPFRVEEATDLKSDPATARGRLLPLEAAVRDLPRVELEPETGRRFCSGGFVPFQPKEKETGPVAVFDRCTGRFLGVGMARGDEKVLLPRKLISQEGSK